MSLRIYLQFDFYWTEQANKNTETNVRPSSSYTWEFASKISIQIGFLGAQKTTDNR